ncbi:MAG: triose-phosphate isomerase [Thermodesulfobacteriota bacterium]|nr:triose-phosphate isomerase [Thermodesulfobacteriota bacterium]
MRMPIIAGNWKMNNTLKDSLSLANHLKKSIGNVKHIKVIIAPPVIHLYPLSLELKGTNIDLAAQNLYWEKDGAFTGEISGDMIKEAGGTYVIIGHSERRQYFGETDETVNKKIIKAIESNLYPIVCVGEVLSEREEGETFSTIETQIKGGLKDLTEDQISKVVVAYEPVWAIGTGKTATPQQAEEVHEYIRKMINDIFSHNIATALPIIYGGSVKPDNIDALMAKANIDGALVGGASLKADSFIRIVNFS